jgi:transporter family-2 protein
VDRALAIVLTLGAGALVAFQPPANAVLAKHVGDLGAAFASLALSTALVGVLLVAAGDVGQLRGMNGLSVEHVIAGVAGAAIVVVSLVTVRTLGVAGVAAAIVGTQLIFSALIDQAGILSVDKAPLNLTRMAGIVLLVAGTILVTSR